MDHPRLDNYNILGVETHRGVRTGARSVSNVDAPNIQHGEAKMTTTEERKRLARRVPEEVATEGKLHLIDELFAEEFVEHTGGAHFDRAECKQHLQAAREAFPDLEVTVEHLVTEGNTVAQHVTVRGTHEGEFRGIEPTGNETEVSNMVFTRIEDGRIVERWRTTDELSRLQQLGATELPPE